MSRDATTAILINGAFRDQRVTGQQRYATEISSRLLRRSGVQEWALPERHRGSRVRAWLSVQLAGLRRRRHERLLTLTSRGPLAARRHVVVVHDTFVLESPEWFSPLYVATHAPVLRLQLRTAELVLAVSEPVARSVTGLIGPRTRVVTVPNAPADVFRPGLARPESPAVAPLVDGFVLSVASEDPRKNLGRLVEAHRLLPSAVRASHPLVLVGASSPIFAGEALASDTAVIRLGYVDDDELARLYASASVVAFPTLAEGFGLPAVEAIASGAEVVVSDIPVLRWVCGEQARFADPRSAESIASAMLAAIEHPVPHDERLRRAAEIRERFSWDRSAELVATAVDDWGGELMRIAQVTGSLLSPIGGAEQYCLAIAERQAADGHEVVVFTGWVDDDVRDRLRAAGVGLEVVPGRRPYPPDRQGGSLVDRVRFHAAELRDSVVRTPTAKAIEAGAFDVVHVHRFAGMGAAPLRVRSTRVVHTVHDFSLIDTSASLVRGDRVLTAPSAIQRARSTVIAALVPSSTTLVFPTPRTLERHREWRFPVDRFDACVLPHGWDLGASRAQPDDVHAAASHDGVRFLFLGKLSEHKGVRLLLDAWGEGIEGASLRIGGSGDLEPVVEAAANVEALGWLDAGRRREELAYADALVFPSLWPENFPLVVAEAILAGLPVVTTTVASPPLVEAGESGLLAEPDPAALRGAMRRLVEDAGLIDLLAEGAADRASLLDIGSHAAELERRYWGASTADQ